MARWWPVLGNTVSFALASSGNMSGRGCPSLKRSSRDYSTTGDYTSCNHIWLVVWNLFIFSIQLGISSFQLTNSIMFQRGRAQPPTRYVWIVIVECLDNSFYIYYSTDILSKRYITHIFIFYILYTLRVSHQEWIRDQILVPKSMAGRPFFRPQKSWGVYLGESKTAGSPL